MDTQFQSQSQRPPCIQCGGTDYVLESGYYFCAECQVQSQDIREEVYEDYSHAQKSLRVTGSAFKQAGSLADTAETSANNLTSWEVLNIVLERLINELLLLGAPKKLKIVALQLWARSLMKAEVAFLSKNVEKRPRLSLNFKPSDAKLIYGTDNEVIKAHKRPIYQRSYERSLKKSDDKSSKEVPYTTEGMLKLRLQLKKRKLATAEYEYAASSSFSSEGSEISLEDLSSRSSNSTSKSIKFKYSRNAKNALVELLDGADIVSSNDRSLMQKRFLQRNYKSPEHITILKLLAIIRISLLILDSEIQLGDLLRWSNEGYLSLLNAEKFLPSGIKLSRDLVPIFITSLNSRDTINRCVIKMADSLGIDGLKSRILHLIDRYLDELNLPDELYKMISNLIALSPPKLNLTSSVNYEAKALAFIIFVLKYIFGLDGATEKRISKIKALANNVLGDREKLFSWNEWMEYIICRSSFISVYHLPTRDVHYSSSHVGGSKPLLSQWEKISAKHTLNSRGNMFEPDFANCILKAIDTFIKTPSVPPSSSLKPQSNMLKTFLQNHSGQEDFPPRKTFEQNFKNCSVKYLIDQAWQEEIHEKHAHILGQSLDADIVHVEPISLDRAKNTPSKYGNKLVTIRLESHMKRELKSKIKLQRKLLHNPKSALPKHNELLREKPKEGRKPRKGNKPSRIGIGEGYWIYHSSFSNPRTQAETFDYIAGNMFPPEFIWLLKECSLIGNVSTRDVYCQLTEIEKIYLLSGKKSKTSFCN